MNHPTYEINFLGHSATFIRISDSLLHSLAILLMSDHHFYHHHFHYSGIIQRLDTNGVGRNCFPGAEAREGPCTDRGQSPWSMTSPEAECPK